MRRLAICLNFLVAACVAAALVPARSALAVTHTWTGAAMTSSMNTAGNWTGGTPISGDTNLTLIFPTGTLNSLTQDIANPLDVERLQFNSGFSFITMGANPLRLSNLGTAPTIEFNGTAMQTVNFGVPVEFNAPTGLLMTGSSVTSMSFQSLSGTDATFDATGNSHSYFLQGTTANSLTGSYLVKGMSQMRLAKPANTAAIGGIATVDGSMASIIAMNPNQFAAGADVKLINSGQLQMSGNSQSIDELVVESGGLVTFSTNETLTINGTISSSAGVGSVGFGIVGTIDFAGQFKSVNVTSTGAGDMLRLREKITNGSINKTGAGKLEIGNSNNSFSGVNVVTAGTLSGNPASIGTVTNNDKVELTGFGTLVASQISGPGQVIISNASVTYGGAQAYAGGTHLDNGAAFGDASTLLGNFTSAGGSSLQFGQNTNATWGGSLSGTAGLGQSGTGILGLGGANNYSGTTFVAGGGIDVQSDTAIGTGALNLFGPIRATGSRTLANVLVPGVSTFEGTGNFNFTDTTVKQPSGSTTHNSSGITNIAGKWLNGPNTITVTNGQLAIGDAAVVNGFTSSGSTIVNGGTLTLRSLNFITLPDVTLAGGTLNTPNGYAIPLGAVLQGNGAVTGRVASANGSSILANGNLAVGDAAHVAGVNLDGELYTNQYAVTLDDSNQAVVGSLTHLGDGTNNGMLNAPNGLVVNFGRNITGRGQVNSTNTLARAVIMNGDAQGDSFVNYLEFTGYVKGVGTFNNVAFSGTFAPGLSPAVVEVGNAILTSSNVLDMEIGGTERGSEYDGIDVTGGLSLGGELQITLLNGFLPGLGDQWQLFDGPTSGMFASYDFPTLADGLTWKTTELYTMGAVSVVAGLDGDFNGDGVVDTADYVLWRRGLGTTHAPADLGIWHENFGRTSSSAASLATAVPEPATLVCVLSFAAAGTVIRRRRPVWSPLVGIDMK
jgi:autotransporter-associated beta strand protein